MAIAKVRIRNHGFLQDLAGRPWAILVTDDYCFARWFLIDSLDHLPRLKQSAQEIFDALYMREYR